MFQHRTCILQHQRCMTFHLRRRRLDVRTPSLSFPLVPSRSLPLASSGRTSSLTNSLPGRRCTVGLFFADGLCGTARYGARVTSQLVDVSFNAGVLGCVVGYLVWSSRARRRVREGDGGGGGRSGRNGRNGLLLRVRGLRTRPYYRRMEECGADVEMGRVRHWRICSCWM
jgi:hypothetical protein